MDTADLHRWLDAGLAFPPETRTPLSSHLPMALHALHALGAGEARLAAFFDTYTRRFEGRRAGPPPDPAPDWRGWRALREGPDPYPALRAAFGAALAREGRDAVLRAALPGLLEGVAAAAFHGAIRSAHAVEAAHERELAAALAYWAWRWQPLAPPAAGEALAFEDWAAQWRQAARGWTTEGPLIAVRMASAAQSAPCRALAGRLAPAPDLLPRLATLALERYAASGNFTVLHMVTGLRALAVLTPWFDAAAAAPGLVTAFCAAWLAARMAPADLAPQAPLPWRELTKRACAQDDDHVIKLVHACHHWAAAGLDDESCRRAATRALEPT